MKNLPKKHQKLKEMTNLSDTSILRALYDCCRYYLSFDELIPYLESEMARSITSDNTREVRHRVKRWRI